MHVHLLLRRAFATLSALALILNLGSFSLFSVPTAHASDDTWTERYWNVRGDLDEVSGEIPDRDPDFEYTVPDHQIPEFFLGNGSPHPGDIGVDAFEAEWSAFIDALSGSYTFRTFTDDGVRLYIDDELIIDDWNVHPERVNMATVTLTPGGHNVRMEYFESDGEATMHLDYHPTSDFGNGSPAHPYLLHTCGELQTMFRDLDASYALANDIDCGATEDWHWDAGTELNDGFIPIGSDGDPFVGAFDGNGHTISNLYISRNTWDGVGLFGAVGGEGVVHDVNLVDVDITGHDHVGALVGTMNGTITYTSASGTVHGAESVGGLVGTNFGTVETSYATADVEGYMFVGGLVGDSIGRMTNVYARGNATGFTAVGGLLGLADANLVINAYSTGIPSAAPEEEAVGGLIGYGGGMVAVIGSFWDSWTSGVEEGSEGLGLTTDQLTTQSTFTDVGWDFHTIWQMNAEVNDGYPTFRPVIVDDTSSSRLDRLLQVYGEHWDNQNVSTPESEAPSAAPDQPEAPESEHAQRTGPSPWDGTIEPISDVATGMYIRGAHFDTVYYIDSNMARRPFWDAKTFRTYADWNQVTWVTDATLATLKLSAPMTPKPGAVLVKIEGDPRVYAVMLGANGLPLLRELPTEAIAIAVYGAQWADYVIDIPPTMLTLLGAGDPVSANDHPDLSTLMKRTALR